MKPLEKDENRGLTHRRHEKRKKGAREGTEPISIKQSYFKNDGARSCVKRADGYKKRGFEKREPKRGEIAIFIVKNISAKQSLKKDMGQVCGDGALYFVKKTGRDFCFKEKIAFRQNLYKEIENNG